MHGHNVSLSGTGCGLPGRLVANQELEELHGLPPGWLVKACGVETRPVSSHETQVHLAHMAARSALSAAGVEAGDVDLLVCAQAVPAQPIPSMAPLIAQLAGVPIGRCKVFDVNATCLGFLNALDIVRALAATDDDCRTALIVASDLPSKALDWTNAPAVAGLFGDGAAAAVIQRTSGGGGFAGSLFETHHDAYRLAELRSGGTALDRRLQAAEFEAGATFTTDGHALFRIVAARFPAFLEKLLHRCGWDREDVDVVIPHQASALGLRHMSERCGFRAGAVVDIVATHGNQVAASLPMALHVARTQGRLSPGSKVLLLGTSAGVMFGGIGWLIA